MKLKELTQKIGSGATPSGGKNAYLGGDISLIRSQNVLDFEFCTDGLAHIDDQQASKLANVEVRADDVLLNITGDSVARCCRTTKDILPARVNQHVSIIRPKEGISSSYLMYWLLFMKPHLLKICKIGGTRNAITKETLEELDIDYPAHASALIKPLEAIDAKIAVNKKLIHELEETTRLIYDNWFTQFDFPDENGKPYRSSGGKMVWNDQLKREIPEGWEAGAIGDFIEGVRTGLNPRNNFKLTDSGWAYLTVKNLTATGEIDFSSCDYIDDKAREIAHKRSDVSKGDVLFASISPLGRCHLVQSDPEDWEINESVFSIRPNTAVASSEFLYMFFTSPWFVKAAEGNSTGSVFKGIRHEELRAVKTFIPEFNIIQDFTEKVAILLKTVNYLSCENEELVSLRDWLLPMFMNGQAKVS